MSMKTQQLEKLRPSTTIRFHVDYHIGPSVTETRLRTGNRNVWKMMLIGHKCEDSLNHIESKLVEQRELTSHFSNFTKQQTP